MKLDLLLVSASLFLFTFSFFNVKVLSLACVALLGGYLLSYRRHGGVPFDKASSLIALSFFSIVFLFSIFNEFYFNYFLKVTALTVMMILMSSYYLKLCNRYDFLNSLKLVVALHSGFFLIQFIVYMTTGYFIPFDSYIRDYSDVLHLSRALDGLAITIRGTGLFSEPSFYSMSILPFALAIMVIEKRIGLYALLGLGTALLSLSIASIIIVTLSLLIYSVFIGLSKFEKSVAIAAVILSSPFLYTVYDLRINQAIDYDAVSSRELIFDEIAIRGWNEALFGWGFLWDGLYPQGHLLLNGAHVRDSSFYMYLVFCSGYVGLIIFLALTVSV
ncbi:MAG: hypothetical protein RPR97_02285, partial [Colwellia sp.]